MEEQIIPIVYASDENFLKQTYVSIYSVLANRKQDYDIKFYILVPEGCKEADYNINWDFMNYSIEYIPISSSYFVGVKMTLQNITKPTYYRLLIPMLLSEYNRCLYLDGDTVCLFDIEELYRIELENNLIAAAMGAIIPFDGPYREKVLNIPDATHYINAGVLIMNLQQMRSENKVEEFLKCSERELHCQDQDVLNICCYNYIKLLPLRYNIYNTVFNMSEQMLMERYTKEEIREAFANPAIIHYPGEFSKPWNNLQCVKSTEWWDYAICALKKNIVREMKDNAQKRMEHYDYNILFEKVKECKQLVIFGFSELGQAFCEQVDEIYPNRIVCFGDNAKEKQEKTYRNYEVLSPYKIKEKFPNALIVVTSQRYSNIIEKQLLENGFSASQIVVYRKKIMKYLYSMDKMFWNEAKKEIHLDNLSWNELIRELKIFEEDLN